MINQTDAFRLLKISQDIRIASIRLSELLKSFESHALNGSPAEMAIEREKIHAQMDHLLDLFEQGQQIKKKVLNL